jgi:hypothetical protein
MPFLPKTPNKVFHVTMSGAHPDACIQDHSQEFNNKGAMGNETSSNNSPLYSSVCTKSKYCCCMGPKHSRKGKCYLHRMAKDFQGHQKPKPEYQFDSKKESRTQAPQNSLQEGNRKQMHADDPQTKNAFTAAQNQFYINYDLSVMHPSEIDREPRLAQA